MKLLFALVSMGVAFSAQAWNSTGHRAVAEIVWQRMSVAQRQAAFGLLKQHPHYTNILIAEVPAGVATNEWAFLTAAVWPDLVRPAKPGLPARPESVTKYNIYPHGIGLPFLRAGDGDRALLTKFPTPKPDARVVLADAIATLNNRKASPHDRAVSLCVVLHLFGDLHQPLHTATLVTRDKPRGHNLGGDFVVRDRAGEKTNLHTFWDQLPGADASYESVLTLANSLACAAELQPAALKEYRRGQSIRYWVQETFETAVKTAYAEGRLPLVDQHELASGGSNAEVPTLSADYVAGAQKLMRRRLALAALRLSEALSTLR